MKCSATYNDPGSKYWNAFGDKPLGTTTYTGRKQRATSRVQGCWACNNFKGFDHSNYEGICPECLGVELPISHWIGELQENRNSPTKLHIYGSLVGPALCGQRQSKRQQRLLAGHDKSLSVTTDGTPEVFNSIFWD